MSLILPLIERITKGRKRVVRCIHCGHGYGYFERDKASRKRTWERMRIHDTQCTANPAIVHRDRLAKLAGRQHACLTVMLHRAAETMDAEQLAECERLVQRCMESDADTTPLDPDYIKALGNHCPTVAKEIIA